MKKQFRFNDKARVLDFLEAVPVYPDTASIVELTKQIGSPLRGTAIVYLLPTEMPICEDRAKVCYPDERSKQEAISMFLSRRRT